MRLPANRQRMADLHAQQGITPWSPFISVTESVDSLLGTEDIGVAEITTGYGNPSKRAPYIFTYDIPESMLIRPRVGAAEVEKEWLYFGRKNIREYLLADKTVENPYQPSDLKFERFRLNLGLHGKD